MKKYIILILLLLPIVVNADYKVTNHYINAEIEIAGALNVQELIVVEGDSPFISRKLNYYSFGTTHWNTGDEIDLDNGIFYNGQSIEMNLVGAYPFDGEVDFENLTKNIKEYFNVFNIENPSNSYTYIDNKDGTANLKIFYPFKEKTAFYINYVITNVVVKHNDVKELNYTFKNLNLNSKETMLRVIIPYQTTSELYHIWIHGNLSGEAQELVNKNDEHLGLIAKFPEVKDSINIRVTLPQEQVGVDMFLNKSEKDALDDIIKIEKIKEENTKKSQKFYKNRHFIYGTFGVIFIIGLTLLTLVVIKNKKKRK